VIQIYLDPEDIAACLDGYLEPEIAEHHGFDQREVYFIGRAADALRKRGPSGASNQPAAREFSPE